MAAKPQKIIVNMIIAGSVAFVGVALIVLVSTFVSPVWTLLATALPFMLIVSVATMQASSVNAGRIRGTMMLTWISSLITMMFLGVWLLVLFFGMPVAEGVKSVWGSFAAAAAFWAVSVATVILLYLYWPRFQRLVDEGTIHKYSIEPLPS